MTATIDSTPPQTVSARDVAKAMGLTKARVYAMVKQGHMTADRIGVGDLELLRIHTASAREFMERRVADAALAQERTRRAAAILETMA